MTPEFLKQCLSLYGMMKPDDFIRFVYLQGQCDGRSEELKAYLAIIDSRLIGSKPTVIQECMDSPTLKAYQSADPIVESGLDRWLEHRGGCDETDC